MTEDSWARSQWLLPWEGHFEELNLLLVPHGKTGRIRVEGRRARSQCRPLERGISRISFFYLVPGGTREGAVFIEGRPETCGVS
jgi:hypothetical protein